MPKLSKQRVDAALRKPFTGEWSLWDSEIRGLSLRVRRQGIAAYYVFYRVGARQRRMKLGDVGTLTPDGARTIARRILADVAAGRDPSAERKEARRPKGAIRFADVAERWIAEHAVARLRPSSLARVKGLLKYHVLPAFGRVRIEDLAREHVARLHHAMRAAPVSANRARALVSAVANFAERVGLRRQGTNPCRHVTPYPEERRRRFLSGEEMARLGDALARMERENAGPCDQQAVAALRLLLLTGARAGEILALEWEQVDEARGVLRLPRSKTGAKEISLGPAARAILADLPRDDVYVIPGAIRGRPLIGLHRIWKRVLRRAGIDATVRLHDLRRTAASAAASSGLSLEATGQLLGHANADTTKRYAYLFDDARREAAERMESALSAALAESPKVVPIRR
jgi:integrase